MKPVWLLGRLVAIGVRSIRIWVFLDGRRFTTKSTLGAIGFSWIFLDFLGFSRPNLDFSIGYTGFSAKKISRALLWRRGAAGTGAAALACRGSFMGRV